MLNVTELTVVLKKIGIATYAKRISGITFKSILIFQTQEKIATDRLLISDEGVRVLSIDK